MVWKHNSIYTSNSEHELNKCIENQLVLPTMYFFTLNKKTVFGIFASKFLFYLKCLKIYIWKRLLKWLKSILKCV